MQGLWPILNHSGYSEIILSYISWWDEMKKAKITCAFPHPLPPISNILITSRRPHLIKCLHEIKLSARRKNDTAYSELGRKMQKSHFSSSSIHSTNTYWVSTICQALSLVFGINQWTKEKERPWKINDKCYRIVLIWVIHISFCKTNTPKSQWFNQKGLFSLILQSVM